MPLNFLIYQVHPRKNNRPFAVVGGKSRDLLCVYPPSIASHEIARCMYVPFLQRVRNFCLHEFREVRLNFDAIRILPRLNEEEQKLDDEKSRRSHLHAILI